MTIDRAANIIATPGVCGGDVCVTGTRIPVWLLARAVRDGCSADQVLEMFPNITAEGLQAAIDYSDAHADEIARQIRENEESD